MAKPNPHEWEADASEEWALETKEQHTPQASRRGPPALFTGRPDNAAKKDWRHNTKYAERVRLPRDFAPRDQRPLREARQDPRRNNQAVAFQEKVDEISTASNTHITLEFDNGQMYLAIWGAPNFAAEAQRLVKEWVQESTVPQFENTQKHKSWAKVPSLTQKEKKELYAKLDTDTRKQRFKRAPPEDNTTENEQGCFIWPVDDENREQVLGASFEALDPIRMDHDCYITFNPMNSVLTVWGSSKASVQQATIRIRGTYYQIRARNIAANKVYLFYPLEGESLRSEIELVAHAKYNDDITPLVYPQVKVSSKLLPECERIRRQGEFEEIKSLNAMKVRRLILRTFQKIEYYRGHLGLRARLGIFVLRRYKKGTGYSLAEFEEMMADPLVEGEVMEDLGHMGGQEDVWQTLMLAPHFAQPDGSKPVFTATFLLNGPEDLGPLEYEVQYTCDEQTRIAERVSERWVRLNWDTKSKQKLLEVCLVDLENLPSWNFELTAGHIMDETRFPALVRWSEQIEFLKDVAIDPVTNTTRQFFTWKRVAGVQALSYHQKTMSRFSLNNTGYVCDVERVQNFAIAPKAPKIGQPSDAHTEDGQVHWSVSVFRPEWATMISANSLLDIGEGVTWKATVEALFGAEGVEGLLSKLEDLAKLMAHGGVE